MCLQKTLGADKDLLVRLRQRLQEGRSSNNTSPVDLYRTQCVNQTKDVLDALLGGELWALKGTKQLFLCVTVMEQHILQCLLVLQNNNQI